MDPLTIGLIVAGLMAMGKKKAATPEATAATSANVDAMLMDLQQHGATAAEKIRSELKDQAKALGLYFGGTGHAPDADGRTAAVFATATANSAGLSSSGNPTALGLTDAQVHSALGNSWDDLDRAIFLANRENAQTQGAGPTYSGNAANAIENAAVAFAAGLQRLADLAAPARNWEATNAQLKTVQNTLYGQLGKCGISITGGGVSGNGSAQYPYVQGPDTPFYTVNGGSVPEPQNTVWRTAFADTVHNGPNTSVLISLSDLAAVMARWQRARAALAADPGSQTALDEVNAAAKALQDKVNAYTQLVLDAIFLIWNSRAQGSLGSAVQAGTGYKPLTVAGFAAKWGYASPGDAINADAKKILGVDLGLTNN